MPLHHSELSFFLKDTKCLDILVRRLRKHFSKAPNKYQGKEAHVIWQAQEF